MDREDRLAAGLADCASANFAFQVQSLHLGSGEGLLAPRCLSGLSFRMAGFIPDHLALRTTARVQVRF